MFSKWLSSISPSEEKVNDNNTQQSRIDTFKGIDDTRIVSMSEEEKHATIAGGSERIRIDSIGLSATFRFSLSYGDKTHA